MGFSFPFFILFTEIIQVFGDNLTWGAREDVGVRNKKSGGGGIQTAGPDLNPNLSSPPGQRRRREFVFGPSPKQAWA